MYEMKYSTLIMTLFGAGAILGRIGLRSALVLGLLCLFGVLSPAFAAASMLLIPVLGAAVALARYRSAVRKAPKGEIEITVQIEGNGLIRFDREAGADA